LLVQIGEYQKGSDPIADQAIAAHTQINEFLKQGVTDLAPYEQILKQLTEVSR